MKIIQALGILTVLAVAAGPNSPAAAAEAEGVALAIVYDTSGSMREPVRDHNGQSAPKFLIANRALTAIARQVQVFATNNTAAAPRNIQAALFIFQGETAKEAIKLAPFDAVALQDWAKNFSNPNGGTPLGNTLESAAKAVLKSPMPRKHVLVITDGNNTLGPQPAEVMTRLTRQAEQQQATLSVHFVAFDVDAKVFDPVKKLGATVVGAADEQQLNLQLDFILQQKILLEAEEPVKKK